MKPQSRLRISIAAVLAALVAASCYGWSVWDQVFDPASSSNGWYVGDGAISVPLPPCIPGNGYTCKSSNPRALWMFGDTWLDYHGASGQPYMVNNTIAVQERQDGEPPQRPGEITFWARRWWNANGISDFITWDVTTSVPTFSTPNPFNMTGFMKNGDETDPSLKLPLTTTIWGAGGVFLPNDGTADGKVVLFYEPTRCHGPASTQADYVACRNTFDPPPEFLGERLLTIDNPNAPPDHWLQTVTDLGAVDRFASGNVPRVRWGAAVLYDDPLIYIYGRPSDNDVATRDVDESVQVKVAAATVSTITNYTQWNFLVNDGNGWMKWQVGPPASVSDLVTVANTAANIWSVSKITYKNQSQYVMVEPIAATTHGVLRTSPTPLLWPDYALPPRDPATGQDRRPVSRTDYFGNVAPAGPSIVIADVKSIEPNLGWFARDFRAHPELRGTSTVPSSSLLISYEGDAFTDTGSAGGGEGKMRFTKWPLDWTYPFCAAGADTNGDGIGDDLSACEYCGNGKLEAFEDCDPTAPDGARFDLNRGEDLNGNGIVDCSDVNNDLMLTYWENSSMSTSGNTPVGCTSYCTLDFRMCLPKHKCDYDNQCALGQTCECYPTADDCHCSDTGWTAWTSHDTPSGSGDYEKISDFVAVNQSCPKPTGIACRRKSDGRDARLTGEVVTCNTSYGFSCVNANQPDSKCDDYEVRLFCAPTRWFNRDTPNGAGDYEKLSALRTTGDACAYPTAVECRRHNKTDVAMSLVDASNNGEIFTCDPSYGFACVNANQPDGKCDDYEVRFYCGQ